MYGSRKRASAGNSLGLVWVTFPLLTHVGVTPCCGKCLVPYEVHRISCQTQFSYAFLALPFCFVLLPLVIREVNSSCNEGIPSGFHQDLQDTQDLRDMV